MILKADLMPRVTFRVWVIVTAVIIAPIVFEAGFAFVREFGPAVAIILTLLAWACLVGMTYFAFRAIGQMLGD